jgi:hypothetical protein
VEVPASDIGEGEMRRWCVGRCFVITVALVCLSAASAVADGLPVLGVDVGNSGVTTQDGASRYVTLPAGDVTVVARVDQDGGRVMARRNLDGRFTVPAVAYDGSADGISFDGSTLVLIQPRQAFPRAATTFAVLDAAKMRLRSTVRLDGDFSFDAISPDGRTMYLVQYLSPTDPTSYRVRAYDLAAARLLPKAIVDPTEPAEEMGGIPLTRATSPDGRWAYTLYQRNNGEPFVHALDTLGRTARCIDLEALTHDLRDARLDVDPAGATLSLVQGQVHLATIDTSTFAVVTPPSEAAPSDDTNSALRVALAAGAALLLAALALGVRKGVAARRVTAVKAGAEPPDPVLR